MYARIFPPAYSATGFLEVARVAVKSYAMRGEPSPTGGVEDTRARAVRSVDFCRYPGLDHMNHASWILVFMIL